MAFLDNSGDIILDAVLTDTGRLRLAQGNGNFKISYFAFGDDEINYNLYNKNHPSGSAYYDLDILQTPIFEAFTNNASTVKYPLLTNQRTDLLYLPSLLINTLDGSKPYFSTYNLYLVGADSATSDYVTAQYALDGVTNSDGRNPIRLDQGINSTATDATITLETSQNDLYETQYIIELNSKLLFLTDKNGSVTQASFIDDDGMATYSVGAGTNTNFVTSMVAKPTSGTNNEVTPILGTRGSKLEFKLKTTTNIQTSTYLFTNLGGETDAAFGSALKGDASLVFYYIDTYIKVTGIKTGVSNNVPVRIIKKKTT
jgi:hypothetical protein